MVLSIHYAIYNLIILYTGPPPKKKENIFKYTPKSDTFYNPIPDSY